MNTTAELLSRVSTRAEYVDDTKAELDKAIGRRDNMIRKAYKGGASIADLVRATGLTRTMLYKIVSKE